MLATKVVCPNCSRTLKTATPLPVGKKVLCRQCGTTFGVPPDDGPHTPTPAKRLAASPAPEPAAPAAGMSKGLIFGAVIAGAVLLMVAGSVGAVAFAFLKHRAPDKLAQATAPTPDPKEGDGPGDKTPEYCPPVKPHDDKPITLVHHEVEKPAEKPWLPKEEQEKVDKAIERGLEYLRKQQQPAGSWGGGQPAAMAALPGLTLLECGAKADDPQVVKAADLVRQHVKSMNHTYALALCILFLDRLGDPKDKPYIQTMALRLVAGQTTSGGWSYECPILSDKDERELLEVLQDTRPARAAESITDRSAGAGGSTGGAPGEITARPGEKPVKGGAAPRDPKNLDQPFKGVNANPPGANPTPQPGNVKGDKTKPSEPTPPRATADKLSPALKRVLALQPAEAPTRAMSRDAADNSNTQFAILAIWVSGRHDVPTEKVCALIDRRFRTSQGTGGGWGYNYSANNANPNGSPAMTAAGLLGLAVGHGVSAPNPGDKPAPKEGVDDEAIKKGFKHLSEHLGKSKAVAGKPRGRAQGGDVGLYFLWSVERVGVMYNLRQIGDKDWYAWGSEMIVDHQNNDGSWHMGNYVGSAPPIDTCFALLFLKRANLAKDLSTKIEYLIDIKGVGGRN